MSSPKKLKAVSSFVLIIFPVVLATFFSIPPKITGFHATTFCSSVNSSSANITKISDKSDIIEVSVTGIINTTGAKYSYTSRTKEKNKTTAVKVIIERPDLMPLPACVSGDWRSKYNLNMSIEPDTKKISIIPELSGDIESNISEKTLYLNNSN